MIQSYSVECIGSIIEKRSNRWETTRAETFFSLVSIEVVTFIPCHQLYYGWRSHGLSWWEVFSNKGSFWCLTAMKRGFLMMFHNGRCIEKVRCFTFNSFQLLCLDNRSLHYFADCKSTLKHFSLEKPQTWPTSSKWLVTLHCLKHPYYDCWKFQLITVEAARNKAKSVEIMIFFVLKTKELFGVDSWREEIPVHE